MLDTDHGTCDTKTLTMYVKHAGMKPASVTAMKTLTAMKPLKL